ncbi:MAG TPA: tetratricopeptide repeat protein [Candidatus Acidoferrum sp.]|jgi:tetratricopeptide (TPR) repeat protein
MRSKRFLAVLFVASFFPGVSVLAESRVPEAAKNAFAAGDYSKAIEILNREITSSPRDAAAQHLLARCYFENEEFDRAIQAAEAAVSSEPKNSGYHELLGHAYGEKADRSGWLGALSLAKKARKEFETAVRLDERNFSAMQALIEFDCSAPGIAGGGEDKARPEIERLAALDAAEGRYAEGNCRRQKKDFTTADMEFRKSLALHPKSTDLIYDIGDHYMKHGQPDALRLVVTEGERLAPSDPRGEFFRAVAMVLEKQNQTEAARLFSEYLQNAPKRNNYPSKAMTHYWLGQIQENQNNVTAAKMEYQEALNLEPKNRFAKEALHHLQHN